MIQLKNVSYTYAGKYQRVEAIKSINYAFEPGKLYTITGTSGSGKSTLLSLMMGYDQPTVGDINLNGRPIKDISPHIYRTEYVSMIYQDLNLLTHLNVLENAAFSLMLRRVSRKDAYKAAENQLRDFGLCDAYFKRMPSMLSGGEQQRVAISRAVCAGVKVILADEPTGSLDSCNTQVVMSCFRRLVSEKGCTVIIVTHDPEVAKQADIQLCLKDGVLLEQ